MSVRIELVGGPWDGKVIQWPDAPDVLETSSRHIDVQVTREHDAIPPEAPPTIRYRKVSAKADELGRVTIRYVLEGTRDLW